MKISDKIKHSKKKTRCHELNIEFFAMRA